MWYNDKKPTELKKAKIKLYTIKHYHLLVALLVAVSVFGVLKLWQSKISQADLTSLPGEITINSVSPASVSEGTPVTVSGTAIGGDGFDQDCPFPPTDNHTFNAYRLTSQGYTVSGGTGGNVTFTQTQAGAGHNPCQPYASHTEHRAYLYSFSFVVNTSGLASGPHTVTVSATDVATGATISDTASFTVSGIPPVINPSCSPPTTTLAVGQTGTFTVSSGIADFSWSAPGSSNSSGSGTSFSTSYNNEGTYNVTVTDSATPAPISSICYVVVTADGQEPPAGGALACAPSSQNVPVGVNASLSASGGNGSYVWSAPSGSPSSGSGTNFSTKYNSAGSYNVTVTSNGVTVSCAVTVSTTLEPFTFPTATISARNPTTGLWSQTSVTIDAGTATHIRWSSSNTSSCTITSSPIDGSAGTPRSELISPGYPAVSVSTGVLTSAHVYSLNCLGTNDPSTSISKSVTVNVTTAPDFTLACNTLSKTVIAGASTVYDTTVTALNGFNSSVTVSISPPLPSGVGYTPITVTPTAVASVPVSTQVTTPLNTYTLTFTATGGGKTHTCDAFLVVTDGNPYLVSLNVEPKNQVIAVGGTQSYTADAGYSDGSSAPVTKTTVFDSSNPAIAQSLGGPDFEGISDGVVTITGTYTEGAITVDDSTQLTVGDKVGGALGAELTCPSGQQACSVSYNTSIMLSWTGTGPVESCETSPALIPAVTDAGPGTASTGNLTATTVFTLTCYDADKNSVSDAVTVTVNQPTESFVNSDKDITSINGSAVANGSCNGGTDTVNKTFTTGDKVSFKINLCNVGSSTASNIIVADELNNLAKPATGWNAKYNGGNITPVESGVSPNQTLTFTLPGTVLVGATKSLTFDAVVTPPTPITNTIYRFQNIARISTANGDWTASTPLYIFYVGSKVPSKQEVAP